eukprot:GHVR01100470.1.p1 GENE.GHVR01100470.1~~GHVR01100470.1.p1  ORF type:complete len:118 (+),score=15.68 GHVR01100470.1:189-542(+)
MDMLRSKERKPRYHGESVWEARYPFTCVGGGCFSWCGIDRSESSNGAIVFHIMPLVGQQRRNAHTQANNCVCPFGILHNRLTRVGANRHQITMFRFHNIRDIPRHIVRHRTFGVWVR